MTDDCCFAPLLPGPLTKQLPQMYIRDRSSGLTSITVTARNNFSTVLKRAAFGKERVILTRRGKAIVAVPRIDDVVLLQSFEDKLNIADALAARKEARKKSAKSLRPTSAEFGE